MAGRGLWPPASKEFKSPAATPDCVTRRGENDRSGSAKTPDLHATVKALNEQASIALRARAARDNAPLLWNHAVTWLFNKIEGAYLLEFLILDAIRIEKSTQTIRIPGRMPFDVEAMTLSVGRVKIDLRPVHEQSERISVIVASHEHDETWELYCDVASSKPRWMVVVRETGLRSALQAYLPEKAIELDEVIFKDLLNRSLCGPQPLLSIGASDVWHGLSRLLDFVTSEDVRRSLALGIRTSAVEIGRQVRIATPLVKETARRALPGGTVMAQLSHRTGEAGLGQRHAKPSVSAQIPAERRGSRDSTAAVQPFEKADSRQS